MVRPIVRNREAAPVEHVVLDRGESVVGRALVLSEPQFDAEAGAVDEDAVAHTELRASPVQEIDRPLYTLEPAVLDAAATV